MRLCNDYFKVLLLFLTGLLGMSLCVCSFASEGGFSLGQTRVIFEGNRPSAKVTLNNQSSQVYLINSRVQRTPEMTSASQDNVPFMVTPPLFRLEKQSSSSVLIVPNDTSALPANRESVFYLSFLAIPSIKRNDEKDSSAMQPQVSVGLRSVIKLFYRPTGITMPVSIAPEKLTFHQRGEYLHVENPTPYFLTLAQLHVNHNPVDVREQGSMLAPFSGQDYKISGAAQRVSWAVINDHGGLSKTYQAAISTGR